MIFQILANCNRAYIREDVICQNYYYYYRIDIFFSLKHMIGKTQSVYVTVVANGCQFPIGCRMIARRCVMKWRCFETFGGRNEAQGVSGKGSKVIESKSIDGSVVVVGHCQGVHFGTRLGKISIFFIALVSPS